MQLVVTLFLLAGSSVSAQVVETINENGGTIADPGLKIEIMTDGSYRVSRLGLSETYEGSDDPRGITTYIGIDQYFWEDIRKINKVSWDFISPKSGTGSAVTPWKIQMVGNIPNYQNSGKVTVILTMTYVKDQPYFILDYTVAVGVPDIITTVGHLYLAEHAVLGVSGTDWGGNSVCSKALAPDFPPFNTVGVYRDDACLSGYPYPRAHMFRMKGGFHSIHATDAAGMMNVPINAFLDNIYNNSYDGTENGIVVHKQLGDFNGGSFNAERTHVARILAGYGNNVADLDGVQLDTIPAQATRQLTVQFEKPTAEGQEGDNRHIIQGLKLKVFNNNSLGTAITTTAPLYVPLKAAPSGANPAVAGVDYEYKRGIVIPAGVYPKAGVLIDVDSAIMILGNTALENNREVEFALDDAVNNNLVKVNTSANKCVYKILDDEPRSITLTMPTEIDEGSSANGTVSLPAGVNAASDITVTLTRKTTSTASAADIDPLLNVVIKQNTNSATFSIQALTDKILEYPETLEIQADATVLATAQTASGSVAIKDRTYDDPANRAITMRPVPGVTVSEPYIGGLQFSLPPGVTTDVPIGITLGALHGDPASTASAADYTIGSNVILITSGNSSTVPFTVLDDNLAEGTEKLHVTAIASDGLSRVYDFAPYDIQILDDDANSLTLQPDKGQTTITEGGAGITFTISLPSGTLASADIPLTLTAGGAADISDLNPLPAPVDLTIPAGASTVSFTLSAVIDDLLEGNETLILSGNSGDYAIKPYTLTIIDATTADPANYKLQLSITGSPVKEGSTAGVKVGFVNDIKAGKPIVVNLTRNAASAASATDFTLASSSITIPVGQREVTIPDFITAKTDQILEKAESFTLDGASSTISGLTVSSASASITDATGDDPANKVITIAAQQAQMDEGSGYAVTFSLPAGVTTEVPINITAKTGTGSTAVNADYSFASIPPLDKTNAAVSATMNIAADGLLETDETLVIDGSTTDLPGMTFVTTAVTLKDKDMVANMPLSLSADNTTITEGSTTGAMVTVALPNGKKTSYDIPVVISKDATSTAGDGEHSALPATVVIKQGTGSVTFPQAILATPDNLLEDDETLIVKASAVGFSTSPLTITIKDGSNPKITLQPQPFSAGNKVVEGSNYTVRVALPAGITPYKPMQVTISADAASTAGATDYTGLPVTITLNPGENFQDITLTTLADNILEPQELIRVKGAVSGFAGISANNLDVFIDDQTSKDPTNLQLQVLVDSTVMHEGSSAKVTIGFVKPDITSSTAISINIAPDASFSAVAADYSGLPTTVTLPAGTNQVQQTLTIINDNVVEGTEKLQLKAAVPATYKITSPATITIPETVMEITASKTADAAEPSTNGGILIKLPGAEKAGSDININFTLGGTATGTDWKVTGSSAVIKANTNSVTIPVTVVDDKLMEGDETVTLTLKKAQMPKNGGPLDFPVDDSTITVNIADDEGNAPGRSMIVEKIADAAEPAQQGSFRIRFSDNNFTVVKDVQVTYNVTGSAISGTDYKALSGSVTIPAGQNGVVVNIDPLDDKLVEDVEQINISLQNVTSTMTGVTWPLGAPSQVSVALNDDDNMTVDLSAVPADSIMEGGSVQITIRATSVSTSSMPIFLKIVHDTARTITSSEGIINGNGSTIIVSMPAGEMEHTFTVTSVDNFTNDDNGFIYLEVLPDPSGGLNHYTPGTGKVDVGVKENDPLTLSFSESEYSVNEGSQDGENSLTFEVRLSRPSSRPVSMPYRFSISDTWGLLGSAKPGIDFDSVMKPIVVNPGELVAYIPVSIMGDSVFERPERLSVKLLTPTVSSNQNVPVTAAPDSAVGIILNDDPFCPTCDTDKDGITDGREDRNGNNDPTDDDADGDGIPNFLDLDSDNDGVPDSVEGWITDGRWVNSNGGLIRVHPAVSPNGDGKGNDAMYIENIEKYPDNEVIIINRWGGVVFKMTGYDNKDNSFKGLNNAGKEVTDGSYFFIVHLTDRAGNKDQYTGYIVIKRQ
ncbi:Calx-beta domain-containing protein [Chitinophaga agrisoli]|nr:Calx-beta domain-containing protein [Chitinophaga agrisoli]